MQARNGCAPMTDVRFGQVPEPSFTVADVARVVGEDKAIRPIHVGEQANIDQVLL